MITALWIVVGWLVLAVLALGLLCGNLLFRAKLNEQRVTLLWQLLGSPSAGVDSDDTPGLAS